MIEVKNVFSEFSGVLTTSSDLGCITIQGDGFTATVGAGGTDHHYAMFAYSDTCKSGVMAFSTDNPFSMTRVVIRAVGERRATDGLKAFKEKHLID